MGKRELHKAGAIEINHSRCLRMRFDKNRCSKCIDCCPAGAISIKGGLHIKEETCTQCMLCVAECPSGGLEIPSLNFYSLISKLRKIPHHPKSSLDKGGTEGGYLPVLGCNVQEDSNAHINTFCMGFLSEEHLIALMVFLEAPLQINLTGCRDCKNGFIVDVLRKRLELINSKFQIPNPKSQILNKITLVEDKSALKYQEIPCDRRGFFGALKGLAIEGAANLVGSSSTEKKTPTFSEKILPFKRKLLNNVISMLSKETGFLSSKETLDSPNELGNDMVGGLSDKILKNYYYDLVINENCDMCFACVGMCPTGALREIYKEDEHGENPQQELIFNPSFCSGCSLCSDFCAQSSISIKQGFLGDNPFEIRCVKKGFSE